MRKILDSRDHGEGPLRKLVAEAAKGQEVAMETGEGDTSLVITSSKNSARQPAVQLSQEGEEIVLVSGNARAACGAHQGGRLTASYCRGTQPP